MRPEQVIATLTTAADRGEDVDFERHMRALRDLLGDELVAVERDLPAHLDGSVLPLVETGRHLLSAGGKRIRPILTLLFAGAADRLGDHARALACAGELVHLATLLHDDVIDGADLRRGQPTPRVVWSNTASVLGGDYALTRALDLVSSAPPSEPLREAIETLRLLVEGEVLQLDHRGATTLDTRGYHEIIERKTASLFRWCCRAGAHLGGDPDMIDIASTYGWSLGICFQVVDDVLDFSAATEDLGKAPFTDLRDGKLTLPLLLAFDARPELRDRVAVLVDGAAGAASHGHADAERDLLDALVSTGALDRARAIAADHARRAHDAAQQLPASPWREAMVAIATALASRVS